MGGVLEVCGDCARKIVPITGQAGSLLEFLKLQSQSNLNPNQIQSIFSSSFFLCHQGQSELHLLQSCFSFFVRLHGEPGPFGSHHLLQSCCSFFVRLRPMSRLRCIILQSCSSFFCHHHGQSEVFVSDHLVQF